MRRPPSDPQSPPLERSATPLLRDRLREVLERDRALLDATHNIVHSFTDEASGTRMRLPKTKPRALDADEIESIDALLNGNFAPSWPKATVAPAAEPRTWSEQPQTLTAAATSSAEPAVSSAEPAVSSAEPATSTADPAMSTAEPATLTAAPGTSPSTVESATDARPVTEGASDAASPLAVLPDPVLPSSPAEPSAAWQAARSWRAGRLAREALARADTTPAPTPGWLRGPLPPFAPSQVTAPPVADADLCSSEREARASTPPTLALFADWIAQEVGGLDEPGPLPIVLTPELAPTLHTGTLAPEAREENEEARSGTEPIRTRTMARLLAGHGYKSRALSIYDELLARRPDDVDLRVEAEALRRAPKLP